MSPLRELEAEVFGAGPTDDGGEGDLGGEATGSGSPVRGELDVVGGDAARYVVGGRAVFTVENAATGNRYTFQVKRVVFDDKPDRPFWFAYLLAGPDNTDDFEYVGTLDPSALTLKLTAKSRFRDASQPVRVFRWLMPFVAGRRALPPTVHLYHEGRCCVCGRRLTVPESIRSGIGPVCAGGL